MSLLRAMLVGLAASAAIAVPAPASTVDIPPSVEIGITSATAKIAAFRGRVMWSEPEGVAGAQRRYVLMQRYRGSTSRVPVRPRARRPFDVDLGPDGAGGAVAVYSRCKEEVRRSGCDVYRYDPQSRREHKVRAVSTDGDSEQLPTIWGTRIAFMRGVRRSSTKLIVVNYRTGRAMSIDGGTPSADRGPLGRAPTRSFLGPVDLELYGSRLAFTWDTIPPQCPGESTSNVLDEDVPRRLSSELWLVALNGQRRRVAAGCSASPLSFVSGPSFSDDRLYYQHSAPNARGIIRSETLVGTAPLVAVADAAAPFAQDGRYSYFTRPTGFGRREIRRATLPFAPADQQTPELFR